MDCLSFPVLIEARCPSATLTSGLATLPDVYYVY